MIKLNQKLSKIADDWNALKPREKKELVLNDKQRAIKLRDKLYQGQNLKEGREIVSLYNRLHNKLSGQELKEANKLQHEKLKYDIAEKKDRTWFARVKKAYEEKRDKLGIKMAERKLNKLLKKHGITMSESSLMEHGIPNTTMLKLGKENYIEIRKQMNKIAGRNALKPKELEADIDKKWQEALDAVEWINATPDYESQIKQSAINEAKSFMEDVYFKFARTENQYQRIINEYLEHLSLDKIFDIQSVLTDSKFLQLWDSDQEADDFNEDFRTRRQEDLIKILRNETGKIITVNPENPYGALKIEEWKDDGSQWRFSNFN